MQKFKEIFMHIVPVSGICIDSSGFIDLCVLICKWHSCHEGNRSD